MTGKEKQFKNSRTDFSVLIVEDDEFYRRVLCHQLNSCGVKQVFEACNGRQALSLLKTHTSIQLILCDLDMPEMDGMEFIRHLVHSNLNISLLITSAQDVSILSSVQVMCKAYGMTPLGTLKKPITLEQMAPLVEKARIRSCLPVDSFQNNKLDFDLDEILSAIQNKEIEPYYQAKVDMQTGRIVSAEALARWNHPSHGLVGPQAFISKLEAAGEIDTLTFHMLEQAATDCHRWRKSGLDLCVSVNLSLVSLADTSLADRIGHLVSKIGLEPDKVILEITETAAMTNVGLALENLARLRLRGFGLSIDDFGTGFASMEQLGRVAFTELKIDRSFISSMLEKIEARAIVESSIAIAHRLNIKSVAEGIETAAEWHALKAAKCKLAQGFVVSRPIPEHEFRKLCYTTVNL